MSSILPQHEFPVIGGSSVCEAVHPEEKKRFDKLWTQYRRKVERIASRYAVAGIVGFEFDDLVAAGQQVMVQSIRTYNEELGAFSTYFYTVLVNYYNCITRRLPKSSWAVHAIHTKTGQRVTEKVRGLTNLEACVIRLRAEGWTFRIEDVSPQFTRINAEFLESLDASRPGDKDDDEEADTARRDEASLSAYKKQGRTCDEIITIINSHLKNEPQLQKIAILLFEGHRPFEPGGVIEQMGLGRHQFERALTRIRMLLRSEFDVHLGPRLTQEGN